MSWFNLVDWEAALVSLKVTRAKREHILGLINDRNVTAKPGFNENHGIVTKRSDLKGIGFEMLLN